jgi:hypothetical protein
VSDADALYPPDVAVTVCGPGVVFAGTANKPWNVPARSVVPTTAGTIGFPSNTIE